MKTLNQLLAEAPEDDDIQLETTKKSLIGFIGSNLARFISKADKEDNRSILLLIAALQLINTSDDTQSLTVARRLATAALTKSPKKKT
jgi:hypothetical protein